MSGAILREFHVPWPAFNQDAGRQAADVWNTLADAVDEINGQCTKAVAGIVAGNSGAAIEAFSANWQKYGGNYGSLALSASACRSVANACNYYSDQVSEVKTEIEHKAEELAAAAAAAVIALIFTWGASVLVSEAAGEAFAGWVATLMDGLVSEAANVSTTLADAIGFVAPTVTAASGAAAEGVAAGAIRGTFAAMFNQAFDVTLNAVNGEPQQSANDDIGDLGHDVFTTSVLGVVAEAIPAFTMELTAPPVVLQAYNQALDFSPQLANAILASPQIAAMLDTPAGKALVAGGGIAALHSQGILDETEVSAKSVEASLEGILNHMTSEGGE